LKRFFVFVEQKVAEGSAIMRAEINSQPKQLVGPKTSLIIYLSTNGVLFLVFWNVPQVPRKLTQMLNDQLIEVKLANGGYTTKYSNL